jgi:hypothetical protein
MSQSEGNTVLRGIHSIPTRSIETVEFPYNIMFQFGKTVEVAGCKYNSMNRYSKPKESWCPYNYGNIPTGDAAKFKNFLWIDPLKFFSIIASNQSSIARDFMKLLSLILIQIFSSEAEHRQQAKHFLGTQYQEILEAIELDLVANATLYERRTNNPPED